MGIGDIGASQRASTGLYDPGAKQRQSSRTVGIGIDHDFDPLGLGGNQLGIIQVESLWAGVQFEELSLAGRGLHYRFEIDIVRLAAID